jgi:hypothetical protein
LQNRDEKSAVEMLTHWIRVLSVLHDILDPIIGPALRECASDLFETFHSLYMKKDIQPRNGNRQRPDQPPQKEQVYTAMYWLLSKLNPKIRIYNDDKNFQIKEDTMNGMKIMFIERDYDPECGRPPNTFTSFSIPQMEQPYKVQDSLEHIMEFLTPCLLFCINKNSMDSDLVKRCIKNVLESKSNSDIFFSKNPVREYANSHLYDEDPKIPRAKQLRSFDIIIRMLFAACLVSGKKHEKMQNQIRETIKSFTCHFVLIYICKNGRLINKVDDEFSEEEKAFLEAPEVEVGSNSFLKTALTEINPLLFLDIVCELLYESYQPNNSEMKSYSTGSKIVLHEIFRLLKTFYPDEKDYVTALQRLEFIDILFKKICNFSYSEEVNKKIGCINAIKILIEHCPKEFLRRYNLRIVESQIVIIKNMLLSYGGLPNKLITSLLVGLARKNDFFFDDKEEMKLIVEKVFESFKEVS